MSNRDFGGSGGGSGSSDNREYQGRGPSQEGRRWESSDRDQQRDQYRDRNRDDDRSFDQPRDYSGGGHGGYGGYGGGYGGQAFGHIQDRSGYPGGGNYQGAGGSRPDQHGGGQHGGNPQGSMQHGGNPYGGSQSGGHYADHGDRNPSQGFTGGFGGMTSDRNRGDAGGNYASSSPTAGLGMGGSYYGQGSSNYGFGQTGSHSGPGQTHGQSGQSASSQSYAGRGSKNYRRSDARIEEEVHEVLLRHPEIDATDIDVKVENGEVTLSGETEDRRSRRLVEEIVEQCQGVREVHNELKARRGLLGSISTAIAGGSDADRSDRDVTSKTMSAARENKTR